MIVASKSNKEDNPPEQVESNRVAKTQRRL
jgi:hypothetical protein